MNEKIYKIKFTDEELENLEYYKDTLNTPVTSIVRAAVKEYLDKYKYMKEGTKMNSGKKEVLYADIIKFNNGPEIVSVSNEEDFLPYLENLLGTSEKGKLKAAISSLHKGETITVEDKNATITLRLATDEDVEIATAAEKELNERFQPDEKLMKKAAALIEANKKRLGK